MEIMMKSQKGVTLVALVIYIIVFTIVISILSVISSFFFSNVNFVKEQANYAPEFNKFNMFFIQDVKNNKNVTVNNNTIEFADGTRYDFNSDQKAIYRNGKAIAKNIQVAVFKPSTVTIRNTTKNIVNVNIAIGKAGSLFKILVINGVIRYLYLKLKFYSIIFIIRLNLRGG